MTTRDELIHSHVLKLADFLGHRTDVSFEDNDHTRNMFHAATAFVASVFDAAEQRSRAVTWRPIDELTGESRYILVAHKDYHASRLRYNSRGRLSIQELCFRQEGYEPTHFCELPEFGGEE